MIQQVASCGQRIFGFHIHEGTRCSGTSVDHFADAGSHYNPSNCPHPMHAGDLPPLFVNNGIVRHNYTTIYSIRCHWPHCHRAF